MSYSDPKFLGFIAAVAIVFFILRPGLARQVFLLAVSYAFYAGFGSRNLLLLAVLSLVVYAGTNVIDRQANEPQRQRAFVLVLCATLLPLVLFKYTGFILAQVTALTGIAEPWFGAVAKAFAPPPVGISFYTFAATGYVIDVYIGMIAAERRPVRALLFLSYFPTVTAGPIERGSHLLPQLDLAAPIKSDRLLAGFRQILFGLVLKVVFADNFGGPAAAVFADPRHHMPLEHVVATIFFTFQIYADFAGYSLVAIGSARLFGVELLKNFRQPYLSRNIQEFWRNWHISFSNWLRDYLFTPLRLRWRRRPVLGVLLALMLTFTIAGIWHGAAWTFVCFGVVHGIYLCVSHLTLAWRTRLWARLHIHPAILQVGQVVCTFALVALSFVFFAANSVTDALVVYKSILTSHWIKDVLRGRSLTLDVPGALWLLLGSLVVVDIAARRGVDVARWPRLLQAAVYGLCLLLLAARWISENGPQPFIYYKF